MDTLRITKNQPFVLYVPLVILNADGTKEPVQADTLTDIQVTLQAPCGTTQAIVPTAFEQWLVLSLPATLATSVYNVLVTATLAGGRDFSLRIKNCFEVVEWDEQSNWRDYIVGDHIALDQAFIAGAYITDAEYAELKAELRAAIAAAEQAKEDADAAKAAWEQKAAELDGVAQEQTLTDGISAVRDDISHIDIDTSTLAKATSVKDGNDTAISVGKEIRSEVGTGSDTAAETGTLFAVVKWIKDKVKSIYNFIGTPAEGQPSTLFESALAVQQLASDVQAIKNANIIQPSFDGITFVSGYVPTSVGDFLAHTDKIVEIHDSTTTSISMERALQSIYNRFSNLRVIVYSALTAVTSRTSCFSSDVLEEVYVPILQSTTEFLLYTSPALKIVHMPLVSNAQQVYSEFFGASSTKIIDLMIGAGFTTSQPNMAFWKPTYITGSPTMNDLVTDNEDEFGNPITTNLEQLLYNIRRHIAALLRTDVGNLTISFESSVKSAIMADTNTLNAFPSNWTIA